MLPGRRPCILRAAWLDFVARLTGIPASDIPDALHLIEQFFGDFFSCLKDELTCMKMVPGFERGGGAFARALALGVADYPTRYPAMGWLLERFHNRLVALLQPILEKKP